MLLRTAIAEGVEYVDLEDDIAASIPRFGRTKRIISLHDFRKTPDNLDEIHRRLCELDPDIVKIARWPTIRTTTCGCWSLIRRSKVPTIGVVHGRHRHPHRGFWPASSAHRSPTPRFITSGRWPRASSASSR